MTWKMKNKKRKNKKRRRKWMWEEDRVLFLRCYQRRGRLQIWTTCSLQVDMFRCLEAAPLGVALCSSSCRADSSVASSFVCSLSKGFFLMPRSFVPPPNPVSFILNKRTMPNFAAKLYWRTGIVVAIRRQGKPATQSDVLYLELQEAQKRLLLLLRVTDKQPAEPNIYSLVVGAVEGLIQDWFQLRGSVEVPCCHCLEGISSLDKLLQSTQQRQQPHNSNDSVSVRKPSVTAANVIENGSQLGSIFTFPMNVCQIASMFFLRLPLSLSLSLFFPACYLKY